MPVIEQALPFSAPEAIAGFRIPHGVSRPPTALVAEFLRAAIQSLWDEQPVFVQTVFEMVEDRLGIIYPFRSSLQLRVFGQVDDPSRADLRDTLDWLIDIGDVLDAGGGFIYPSPGRQIELAPSLFALIGGTPSDGFDMPQHGIVGRFAQRNPRHPLIAQSFESWLRAPVSLDAWARRTMQFPIPACRMDASEWEVLHFSPYAHFEKPQDGDWGRPIVVRAKRETRSGHDRFIALLERDGASVLCTQARPISFHDCSRIIQAERQRRGLPAERLSIEKIDSHYLRISSNIYQLPEILSLLTFFCSHRETQNEKTLHFLVPIQWRHQLTQSLQRLGVILRDHGGSI